MNLYKKGRIPLDEIVTRVVNGTEGLQSLLTTTDTILNENCKVLVSFNGAAPG